MEGSKCDVELCCMVLGTRTTVLVQIGYEQVVGRLKEMIAAKLPRSYRSFELELYLAKVDGNPNGPWIQENNISDVNQLRHFPLSKELERNYLNDKVWMRDSHTIQTSFSDQLPGDNVFHVLVDTRRANVSMALPMSDSSNEWLGNYQASHVDYNVLPPIAQLSSFIAQELPTKITLTASSLASLCRLLDAMADPPSVLTNLFYEDNWSPCEAFTNKVIWSAVHAIEGDTTDRSFISFWDALIRNPLRVVFPAAKCTRERNEYSFTVSARPAMAFMLHSVCIFRGEEEAPGVDVAVPRQELYSKLTWIYGDVPYLFGEWSRCGSNCNIPTPAVSYRSPYRRYGDRFKLLLALLQLGRLFEAIVSRCPRFGEGEYMDLCRPSGEIVHLSPLGVRKNFMHAKTATGTPIDFAAVAAHVTTVYALLGEFHVPNVDQLLAVSGPGRTIELQPRGFLEKPTTLAELFGALRHVLEALAALHRASWMHRDIRWSNVLKRSHDTDGGWLLIDFLDSASSPQCNTSVAALNSRGHAPEMFTGSGLHTSAVDLWSVGWLIQDCAAYAEWEDFGARTALMTRLLHDDPHQRPTAHEALQELLRLEAESTC